MHRRLASVTSTLVAAAVAALALNTACGGDAPVPTPDLASPRDLSSPPDFVTPPDLVVPPDFVTPPDLVQTLCNDRVRNGAETDTDCGGPTCLKCVPGKRCLQASDCDSNVCSAGTCAMPSCSDTVKNGNETDVDCGGSCKKCASNRACSVPDDCASSVCKSGACVDPSCTDGVLNGNETGIDCGGSCPTRCGYGVGCGANGDCASNVCATTGSIAGTCDASCTDAFRDGTESDVDCGGICAVCAAGKGCNGPSDCASLVCGTNGKCAAASCTDKVKNGNETDVDCGGSCGKCPSGGLCKVPGDCVAGVCTSGFVCAAAGCGDMVRNGSETDVDCGGMCKPCSDGKLCGTGADCTSLVCSSSRCQVASCTDMVKNAVETDVDCGGGTCTGCKTGLACLTSADCFGNLTCNAQSKCDTAPSCAALKAGKPSTVDGTYTLDPDGTGGPIAPFQAFCDMTTDGGGWMLVTPAQIDSEQSAFVTPVRSADTRGGLLLTVYANAPGCGSPSESKHGVFLSDNIGPWTRIRADYEFDGDNSCWSIFGDLGRLGGFTDPNLFPFDKANDVIRNPVRMGGSNGNAFDGITSRCDNVTANFWHSVNGTAARSASVILRRRSQKALAGLATGVSCTSSGAGTSSPTFWIYKNIFVK